MKGELKPATNRAMSATLERFKDKLAGKGEAKTLGKVVIGTVQGDLHDIGKNLVTMIMRGQGFELAMSALLTTTMIEMKDTIGALQAAGLRDKVKIIVGGAPVTPAFAEKIGADGTANDAAGATKLCKDLLARVVFRSDGHVGTAWKA